MRLLLVLSALLLAGCGSGGSGGDRPAPLTLALDFTPNPVHAPLFAAARETDLEIRLPGAGPDSLKLVASGKADLGVLDIHDLAIARQQGVDVVAVGSLIDRPLAALIAQPSIRRPRDLEGRTVGVSGLPSDPAFVRAIVEHDGGDFDRVELVTIGFNAVSRLISRRVDAAPAFWSAEGMVLRARGVRTSWFRVEDHGAPRYPEVVLITSRATLRAERERLRATLAAIRRGVAAVQAEKGDTYVAELAAAARGDRRLMAAQMAAIRETYDVDLVTPRRTLERWASFDERIGIVERRPDVGAAFDFSLVE